MDIRVLKWNVEGETESPGFVVDVECHGEGGTDWAHIFGIHFKRLSLKRFEEKIREGRAVRDA